MNPDLAAAPPAAPRGTWRVNIMGLPPSTSDVAKSWLATTRGSHVSLGAFAAALGDRGAGLLLLALTLPNVLFIPSVPVLPLIPGIPALLLCVAMALGRRTPRLPGWAGRLSLRKDRAARCIALVGRLGALARPRPWLNGSLARRVFGLAGCVLTGVLCLPLPGLNILAGVGMLVLAIGLAEGDGVMAAVGVAIGLGGSAAVLYALLVIAPAVFGTP
jgi:hypothetical protein